MSHHVTLLQVKKADHFAITIRSGIKQADKFRILSASTRLSYTDLFQDMVDFIDARIKNPKAKEPMWLRVLREEEAEKLEK